MIELPLVFLAGLLGSSHCVGMCGGFALMLGLHARNPWHNLAGQLCYSGGRLFTYGVFGCVAGYCGSRLSQDWSAWINVPATLSLVGGLFLVYQGLIAAGIRFTKKSTQGTSTAGCLTAPLFKTFFQSQSHWQRFLAGVLTGFLPCGLLYGAVALAAASGELLMGGIIMVVFGLGTIPLMVATGVGGTLLSLAARTRLLKVAAICVVLTGGVTIARGAGYLLQDDPDPVAGCPMCHPDSAENSPENLLDSLRSASRPDPSRSSPTSPPTSSTSHDGDQ
ncbi:MAG: sulfite exporter TauE/SafE family protein [Planctomycetaceae bacterium]|nr:sulfite exporter TauE/SafE family protein [Planctomycetaceae bacterium]